MSTSPLSGPAGIASRPAIIYTRGDAASQHRQEQACRQLAEDHELEVVGVLAETPGGSTGDVFAQLLGRLSDDVEVVIAYDLDRLYRNIEQLRAVYDLADILTTQGWGDRRVFELYYLIHAAETERRSDRIRRALQLRRERQGGEQR